MFKSKVKLLKSTIEYIEVKSHICLNQKSYMFKSKVEYVKIKSQICEHQKSNM